jgi:hypothetical protein
MAKGFSIKPKEVQENKPEWDYDKIKRRMLGKTIAICIPGRGCSFTFMKSFTQLCFDLAAAGIKFQLFQDYSSMVNFARCKVLGANVLRGPKQKPWNGEFHYDYQLWIDSDIVYNTEKFWQLCDMAFPEDALVEETETVDESGNITINQKIDSSKLRSIVSGWYCTEDGKTTSCAHWLDDANFRKNGGVMNSETIDTISRRTKPFTVDYVGFGWVLVKHGVFESMDYPWFGPKLQVFENGEVQDFCGEDVSFCLDAKSLGYEIWVDPRIRVGHEKIRII